MQTFLSGGSYYRLATVCLGGRGHHVYVRMYKNMYKNMRFVLRAVWRIALEHGGKIEADPMSLAFLNVSRIFCNSYIKTTTNTNCGVVKPYSI